MKTKILSKDEQKTLKLGCFLLWKKDTTPIEASLERYILLSYHNNKVMKVFCLDTNNVVLTDTIDLIPDNYNYYLVEND